MSRGLWYVMSARTRKSLTLLWTALFLCSLLMQYASLASPTPALAAHNEGIFELEGNAVDQAAAGADWENGPEGAADSFFVGFDEEDADNDVTFFTTGGSKDENDIPSWAITDNSTPDKDDILDAFAAVYQVGGDTWVYFGADRFDNDGTAQIGFWFFQDDVGISGGDFTGAPRRRRRPHHQRVHQRRHRQLDLRLPVGRRRAAATTSTQPFGLCDTATNGSNLNLVAAGTGCDVADGIFDICAKTNDDLEEAPWTFVNKDGETDFGPGQFFEGGINLSDMFGGDAPCFGTFLAETRTSAETDAQLKDFALGDFNTCVPPEIETEVQQDGQNINTINKGESVVDVATFSGDNGEVEGTVEFFVCGPANSAPNCESGGTQVGGDSRDRGRIGDIGRVHADGDAELRPGRLLLLPRRVHPGRRLGIPRR